MSFLNLLFGIPKSNEIPNQNQQFSNEHQIPEDDEIVVYPDEVSLKHQKRPPVIFENGN